VTPCSILKFEKKKLKHFHKELCVFHIRIFRARLIYTYVVNQQMNLMYVWPCVIYENGERYQLDAKIVIYYLKYLYMFRASMCPSSGVQAVCYCIWCSAL